MQGFHPSDGVLGDLALAVVSQLIGNLVEVFTLDGGVADLNTLKDRRYRFKQP